MTSSKTPTCSSEREEACSRKRSARRRTVSARLAPSPETAFSTSATNDSSTLTTLLRGLGANNRRETLGNLCAATRVRGGQQKNGRFRARSEGLWSEVRSDRRRPLHRYELVAAAALGDIAVRREGRVVERDAGALGCRH